MLNLLHSSERGTKTAAAHGITTLDAIGSAIAGKPWLPLLL
jgi:hypothetical protein